MDEPYRDEHKAALRRLAASLRGLIEASVALRAPLATLTELADAAEALRLRAAPHAGERPFPRYAPPDGDDLSTILPWGVISGPYNPLAPPVEMRIERGRALGLVRFGLAYEGPPGGVHGGVVAAVWDQVLAFAGVANDTPGHTGSLTIHYRRITPLHADLRFEGWVDRAEGRRIHARGQCLVGGEVISEAEGVFIAFRDVARAIPTG